MRLAPDPRLLALLLCTLPAAATAQSPAPAQAPPAGETPPSEGPRPSPRAPDRPPSPGEQPSQDAQPSAPQQDPGQEQDQDTQAGSVPDSAAVPRAGGPTYLAAAGVSSGMAVQTQAGRPLGFVVDVVPGPAGTQESGYVVIAGGRGGTTPVPYGAARAMVQDGRLVIDDARFEHAPKVRQSQIEDPSAGWKDQADSYWSGRPPAHSHGTPPAPEPPHT